MDYVAVVNRYIGARSAVSFRALLGTTTGWPPWLPEDAGELEVAALRVEAVDAWRAAYPAPAEEPEAAPEPPEGAWGWVAFEHDVEALMDAVDAKIEERVADVATATIRNLLNDRGTR